MIQFDCPKCSRPIKVKPELAGRKGKCPGCQSILVIPGPSADPAEPKPTPKPPARPKASSPTDDFGFDSSPSSEFDFASSPSPASTGGVSNVENATSSNPYVATAYRPNSPQRKANTGLPLGLGIGSIACGVASAFTCCCLGFLLFPLVVQFPLAVIGLSLGIAGIIYSKGQQGASRVLPIIGTTVSSIGTVFGIGIVIAYMVGVPALQQHLDGLKQKHQKRIIQQQIDDAELQFEIDLMQEREREKFKSFEETEENDPFTQPE